MTYVNEFQAQELKEDTMQKARPAHSLCWKAPSPGHLKINIDASIHRDHNSVGLGGVIRDNEGVVCVCFSTCLRGSLTVEITELLSICEALYFVVRLVAHALAKVDFDYPRNMLWVDSIPMLIGQL
ncbi:Ribonuclease H-like domain containing protein [Parasponia andersonii]|uniref:Ribonuclease H-like domain containing protein n=1 Tax=Parasponia andersonii TaxID=3476 RepID=A0A2P5CGA2_PARAD|nr:Ribonuclease H-like domain containing protein [Parasponia andersonii]PON60084.1 Ribonuclease H-like domain containing protein [Parasponia andersonii]